MSTKYINVIALSIFNEKKINTATMILLCNCKLDHCPTASSSDAFAVTHTVYTNTAIHPNETTMSTLQPSVPRGLSNEEIIAIILGVCAVASTWMIYCLTKCMTGGMLSRVVVSRRWKIADLSSRYNWGSAFIRKACMPGRCVRQLDGTGGQVRGDR
jgi:hypothetical protein